MADIRMLQQTSAYVEYVVSPVDRQVQYMSAYVEYNARSLLTKTRPLGSYGTYSAGAAALAMSVADIVEDNQFTASGNDLVIVHNTDAVAHTITIYSASDYYGRLLNVTNYSIPAGEFHVFGPFRSDGWMQLDAKVYVDSSSRFLQIAVVEL